jgi:hypothetical protein
MPAEAVSPLANGVITDTQGTPNCGIGHAVGGGQHNPGTHHVAMLPAGFTRPGQQHLPLRIGKHYGIATRQRHAAFVARAESVLSATRRATIMNTVPTPPESTKTSLRQRLRARAQDRWPQLSDLTIRHHGDFAYVDGHLPDGATLALFRLR